MHRTDKGDELKLMVRNQWNLRLLVNPILGNGDRMPARTR
jgi:hypothetical protein